MQYNEATQDNIQEVEKIILSAIFADKDMYYNVADIIDDGGFFVDIHNQVFHVMKQLICNDSSISSVLLISAMGDLDDSSIKYIRSLEIYSVNVDSDYIIDCAKYIKDIRLKSKIETVLNGIVTDLKNTSVLNNASDIVSDITSKLLSISDHYYGRRDFATLKEILDINIQQIDPNNNTDSVSVKTGIQELDNHIGGFKPADLIVVAGRPSMGKTALGVTFSYNMARTGKYVLFFSLEMTSSQIANRILSYATNISAFNISNSIKPSQFSDIEVFCTQEAEKLNLFVDDDPMNTVEAMVAKSKRLLLKFGRIDAIVVDYIQMIKSGDRYESRVQEVSNITRSLKRLAKDVNAPVFALSQLSRAVEQREDKKPQLSDLRESGSIEQDADIVLLLYRQDYYMSRSAPNMKENETKPEYDLRLKGWTERLKKISGISDLFIAKHRNGPTGAVKMLFNRETMRFASINNN